MALDNIRDLKATFRNAKLGRITGQICPRSAMPLEHHAHVKPAMRKGVIMGKNVLERGGLNDIKNLHPLASPADDKLEVCKAWYKAFDDRDLDELMKIFSEDPTVTVGAGGLAALCPMLALMRVRKTFAGITALASNRHPRPGRASRTLRPDRAMPVSLSGPFVVMCSNRLNSGLGSSSVVLIRDYSDFSKAYDGSFLHVFRFSPEPGSLRIASLDMFLEFAVPSLSEGSNQSAAA